MWRHSAVFFSVHSKPSNFSLLDAELARLEPAETLVRSGVRDSSERPPGLITIARIQAETTREILVVLDYVGVLALVIEP